jgi:hypothetical protein
MDWNNPFDPLRTWSPEMLAALDIHPNGYPHL